MKSHILGLRVAGVIFGLISIAHLIRLIVRPEVLVCGYLVPLWPSVPAFLILGGLSLWLWKLARIQPK
jgi:hypothetical protein